MEENNDKDMEAELNEAKNNINEFTNIIMEYIKLQQDYSKVLADIVAEKNFLLETITNHNLSKITAERRKITEKNREITIENKRIKEENLEIQNEYKEKLMKVIESAELLKQKQENTDYFIDVESKKKVEAKEKEIEENGKVLENALIKKYEEKEKHNKIKYKIFKYASIVEFIIIIIFSVLFLF